MVHLKRLGAPAGDDVAVRWRQGENPLILAKRIARIGEVCILAYMTDPLAVAVASFETIARRLPILWWAAMTGSPSAQAEARRMVVEKQMALADAMVAVQAEWFKAVWRPWTAERQRDLFGNVVQAASAPVARRAKANARRLRR